MSYLTRLEEEVRNNQFKALSSRTKRLVDDASVWIADATNLHNDSPLVAEKADIVAMRDQFILDLRTQLGV